jgi:hypothetical protein
MDNGVGLRKERIESKKEAGEKKGFEERTRLGESHAMASLLLSWRRNFKGFLVLGGQAGEEVSCCGCGWVKGTSVPSYLSVKGGRE